MRRKWVRRGLGVVLLLSVVIGALAFLSTPGPDHPLFDQPKVLVIAHRGGCGLWPEETLYALQHSMDLGVDVLDIDIHSTRDSVLVLFHNATVDSTTNGTGRVQDFTLAALKALDAGYRWTDDRGGHFPFRGQGITVPTLTEVFAAFPDARLNIEIKPDRTDLAVALGRVIREYRKTEQVIVVSMHDGVMREFRRRYPEVATAASTGEVKAFFYLNLVYLGFLYSPPALSLGVPEYGGGFHVVTPHFIRAAHGRGLKVHVWTINDSADMKRLLDLGVDGIFTNYPDRLLKLLGREKGIRG